MSKTWYTYVIFLVVVPLALFLPYWIQGKVFGTFDLAHITIPMEQLFARYQARGDLPAWVGEFNAGFPLMANGFQSFFYVPHFMLRPFLPAVWLVNISLFLHLLLAAAGMWLLLRHQKLNHTAAVIGALIFSSGGYFAGRITLPHLFFPAAWIPIVLWAAFRLWKKPTISRVVTLAVLYSSLVFSGHIQIAVYAALMLATTFFVWLLLSARTPHKLTRPLLAMIAAGLLIVPLTAVHILPVWEHLPLSRRAEIKNETEAYDVSYPAWYLPSLLNPALFGLGEKYTGPKNEPELMAYVGVSGVLLGILGIASRRFRKSPLGWSALLFAGVGAILAGGGYSPAYRWLHELPTPLAGFANPGRAILLVYLAITIAAAYGTDWLLRVLKNKWWAQALLTVVAVELLVLWHTTPYPVLASIFTEPPLMQEYLSANPDAPRIYSQRAIEPVSDGDFGITPGFILNTTSTATQTIVAEADNLDSFAVDLTWNERTPSGGVVSLEIVDTNGQSLRQTQLPGQSIHPEEPSVFTFDPIASSRGQKYTVRLSSTYAGKSAPFVYMRANPAGGDFNPTGSAATCITDQCQPARNTDWNTLIDLSLVPGYAAPNRYAARELLISMFGEGEGYRMTRAHLTLQWQRYDDYMRALGERGDFQAENLVTNRNMFDRLSIGTVVASFAPYRTLHGMPNMTLVATQNIGDRDIRVYHNNQAWPRFHFAKRVVTASAQDAHELLYDARLKPDEVVIEDTPLPPEIGADQNADIQLIADTGEHNAFHVTTTSPQLLVLRDVNLPGWSAQVDRTASPLRTVDTLFRGVVVPAGEHTIEFSYSSPALRIGMWLSGSAWAVAVLWALWKRKSLAD